METLLQPLMLLEEWILEGLHALGLTWGLAIVALTLLVRLALVPVAVRQAKVSRRRSAHAPQLKAIRERHRDDVAKLRAEMASYRRTHGLQVRGGFLTLILQILVVWSLALLLRSDAAAGTFGDARWLFIPDISAPASGGALVLLLGCWVTVQLATLRMAARVSRRRAAFALLAPLPLLIAAPHVPAGILVYLLVSSTFGLAQRLALRARVPGVAPAAA